MTRSRALVYAALFTPVLLLAAVTAMTWRAEARYERVTERVVHDYAAIAAWQYARRASTALHEESMQAFRGVAMGHMRMGPGSPALADPRLLLDVPADSASGFLRAARLAFTWTATGDQLQIAEDAVTAAELRGLVRRVVGAIPTMHRVDGEPHHMVFDSAGGRTHAIALWILAGPDQVRGAYGVVSDPATLKPAFERTIVEGELVPATSWVRQIGVDDVAVRLTTRDAIPVFATRFEPGATAATDSTGLRQGELLTTVDLSPVLARALVMNAPGSQLPALSIMLLAAIALAAVGLRQERRARELDALRTRFVANVSHELRTPLAQISMFAETLELGRERSDAERRQFAGIIVAEARRLTALVGSVLRHARGERGLGAEVGAAASPASLAEEVSSAIESYRPLATPSGARVELAAAPGLVARLDRGAFRQVMLNLLDNAVKHGGRDGTVRVELRRAGEVAEIIVDDAGPGIPAAERERVFEPFVRLETGGTGAGIGLSVVRDLVRAHGGTARIEDAPGGGARFVISLPVMSAPSAPSASPREQVEV